MGKSKKHKRRDSEIEKRRERQERKLDNSNLHHYNPTSRIPRFLAEKIRPSLPAILKETGWSEKELIDKIYAVRIVKIRIHNAWHQLFSNMFAWQAIQQIKLWSAPDLNDFRVFIDDERRKAWDTVFGAQCTPREAIEIIKTDWWPEYPPIDKYR